jgi:hypothetical protein
VGDVELENDPSVVREVVVDADASLVGEGVRLAGSELDAVTVSTSLEKDCVVVEESVTDALAVRLSLRLTVSLREGSFDAE